MDGQLLQPKIQYGYGKCAQKIGANFGLYRPTTPINPLKQGNFIGVIPMSANISWDYMKHNNYGNAVWNLIVESRQSQLPLSAQHFDYLVGFPETTKSYWIDTIGNNIVDENGDYLIFNTQNIPTFTQDPSIYFVAVEELFLPIMGVKCNRTISIIRPTYQQGVGYQGYSQYLPQTSELIVQGMPASVLEESVAQKAQTKLPTDSNDPRWIVLIPNIDNTTIRIDDIIIDDINQNYVITDNELTKKGWRIIAQQVVNSR